jgi:hypothetical protein
MRTAEQAAAASAAWRRAGTHGVITMSENTQDECPVCGWENADTAREVEIEGRTVRVCCEECAESLRADPAALAKG